MVLHSTSLRYVMRVRKVRITVLTSRLHTRRSHIRSPAGCHRPRSGGRPIYKQPNLVYEIIYTKLIGADAAVSIGIDEPGESVRTLLERLAQYLFVAGEDPAATNLMKLRLSC